MKYFQEKDIAIECLRVREKLNNQYFGKIYRDPQESKTLKQLGIKNN